MSLVFVQNAILCFSSKTGSNVFLRVARDLELPAKFAWGKLKSHIFIQKLSLLPHEYFTTKLFSRNVFRQNWNFLKFIQRLLRLYRYYFVTKSFSQKFQYVSRLISRLSNSRKMHVFSFYVADVTSFQTHNFPHITSLEPLSSQNQFSLKPHQFQAYFLQFYL